MSSFSLRDQRPPHHHGVGAPHDRHGVHVVTQGVADGILVRLAEVGEPALPRLRRAPGLIAQVVVADDDDVSIGIVPPLAPLTAAGYPAQCARGFEGSRGQSP